MVKRILLVVFLLLGFQFAAADIASDIEAGISVGEAVQNAIKAGESAEAIAAALKAARITAVDAARAMSSAGIENAIAVTASSYGMETATLVAALAEAPISQGGGTGYKGPPGNTGGGGGGGGGTTGPAVSGS